MSWEGFPRALVSKTCLKPVTFPLQACIVDAYCPHLGANLGVGGRVHGNCIECPFHGWQFDGETGQCTSIPYADKVQLRCMWIVTCQFGISI